MHYFILFFFYFYFFMNPGLDPALSPDPEAIGSWKYLTSKEFRNYQFQMVELSLFFNTLVCLPTGLGKTFIASNVIFNFYNWFPEGKIFFLAPTRPLVNQQKEALLALNCKNKIITERKNKTI